jgi:ribosomal protein S24E
MKLQMYLFLIFSQLFLKANCQSIKELDCAIKLYETNNGNYVGKDALSTKIRKILNIDIYAGENSIYFEWDEKDYDIKQVNIYQNDFTTPIKTIKTRASDIGHRWHGYVSLGLNKNCTYRYKIEMLLHNSKKRVQTFSITTKDGNRKVEKRVFKIYDDLEGKKWNEKSDYLEKNSKDGKKNIYDKFAPQYALAHNVGGSGATVVVHILEK